MEQSLPYGVPDFDPEVAARLIESHPEHVVRRRDGGMTCPLASHEREWLAWDEDNYAKGTRPHGDPRGFLPG